MENSTKNWPITILVRLKKHSKTGLGIVVTPRPHNRGLFIAELSKDSEAAKAGLLRPGDTILKVDQEVEILVRVPDGYTTRLVTTFNENGVAHTSRITNLVPNSQSPTPQKRRESISEEIRRLKSNLVQNDIIKTPQDCSQKNDHDKLSLNTLVPTARQNGHGSNQASPERPATLSAK
ncbi:PDZ domain-containing protein [Trichonephila inaurata madagascariensis]|uniref:PDZ domain-containing protein n=1 Tax=Trichonephila inaurata madagascariensis TaxID=2747483 RepID=A0A8X6WY68_9ARAC|nr:PDZ domain-containing protein [Trichonephila inaurata madagascariensis]